MTTVSTRTKLPEAKEVRDLLTLLLDRPIDLALGTPLVLEAGERATYATFVDDRLAMRAVAVADLPFSAYAGGALGLVPPAGIQEAVGQKVLSPAIEENFSELLNIFASLMNAEGMPHVKLHVVHGTGEQASPQVVAMTRILGRRLDLELTVGGYGRGRLSLVVIA
ncbi:hypothetical protein V3N99_11015 [Dermatophilaceae bacterium Soc4.6]